MLMNPNKGETDVHGCHCPGDMAVRMRQVLARPPWRGFVLVFHLFKSLSSPFSTSRLLLTLILVDVALTLPLRWLALLICHTKMENNIILSKYFVHFYLAQIPRLSLHYQLALTKFGRRCDIRKMTSKVQNSLQKRGSPEKPCGWGCVVLVEKDKMAEHFTRFEEKEEMAKLLPKDMIRTARIQLDGWHLLFEARFVGYLPSHIQRAIVE